APGWVFAGWGGDVLGTDPVVSVVMDAARTVTATFTSVDGPAITVWYGDEQTYRRAQKWINILGHVADPQGVEGVTYSLDGGAPVPLALGPDLRRLYGAGDFNVEIPYDSVIPGPHTVEIVARDTTGALSARTVKFNKVADPLGLPHTVRWADSTNPADLAQVVDGYWKSSTAGLEIVESGYDRTIAIGDTTWTDYEVEVPVTVWGHTPGAGTPQSGEPLVGLGLHWQGHTARRSESPAVGFYPTGAFAWYRWQSGGRYELVGNDGSPLSREGGTLQFGTPYIMKARAMTVPGGIQYSYKWWLDGAAEPPGWALTLLEDAGPTTGSVLLIAHHVDATFGDVTVRPLVP
ncbi:hypothetical protein GB881_19295, partial [Georgenia subflava]